MVSQNDPYERDSDREYAALEADRAAERTVQQEAKRFDDVDMTIIGSGDDQPEDMYPMTAEIARREEELMEMLDESVNRDPEALAADQARRHSDDPEGDLSPAAREFFDRTTEFRAD